MTIDQRVLSMKLRHRYGGGQKGGGSPPGLGGASGIDGSSHREERIAAEVHIAQREGKIDAGQWLIAQAAVARTARNAHNLITRLLIPIQAEPLSERILIRQEALDEKLIDDGAVAVRPHVAR